MLSDVIPSKRDCSEEVKTEDLELPLFDFRTIVTATGNFSDTNKLGQGGFGCVYKVNKHSRHIIGTWNSQMYYKRYP